MIIRADGYILTNHHVVAARRRGFHVDLPTAARCPRSWSASDEASDLAVLKVDGAEPADASRSVIPTQVKVGDVVLAFGNPLGIGQTVTMGIVSAKGRATGVGDGSYEDFLQTDAPINQGNSGGALVNLQGELVGINAQILSPSGGNIGLGFAIPSTMARAVADQLTQDGVVHRSKLGVTVQPVSPELAAEPGRDRRARRAGQRRRARQPGGHAGLQAGRRHRRARRPQLPTPMRCAIRSPARSRSRRWDRRAARRQDPVSVGPSGGASAPGGRRGTAGGR